ncbi:Auxin-responsive protein IAA8 [Hibiscus syriacus]|uniref:Auxin-responsive protein n=1 Tax=Hibiscus syriacus TaxID=106335 RepID=A0A6A2YN59_HIBSY|nr:Auxin-responsive protein IAA8 [Hibiscus syriacus]
MNDKSDVELPKGAVIKEVTGVPPANDHANAPAAKAHVVGWPPVRSFRKNTMASNSAKNSDEAAGGDGCLYVKVSMDGAPYLRKLDLKTCKSYMELSSAMEKMFSCFTIPEYVVTYADKESY